ncbi:MAG: UDP-glucose--hexose-1-phosphate uridylyltransferase [Clostridiales bacterium]|nr:UDP-glucose--hexose-1-phosphate uridylyltransferase [Clostridiales bacterium]
MINGKLLVEKLIVYAKNFLHLNELDEIYVRNTIFMLFHISSPAENVPNLNYIKEMSVPDVLFNEIKDYAKENNIAEDDTQATLFASYIMGVLTQKPAEINQTFKYLKEKMGAQSACDYLYNLSVMNNYVQKTAISKNIGWEYADKDSVLEITINLSKPEKDNKDIAKLAKAPVNTSKYPMCPLCAENEGFFGSYTHPPRANLRTVSITLGGENWNMQYSPYAYFDEHCIVFNRKHVPMKMTRETINNLFDFVELFPNYFVGSNSDLPIVGGSILNHEHYQGGKHEMPMHKAKALTPLSCEKFPDVEICILNWYNSAIRLTGYNRNTICELGGDIVEAWKSYADESVGVINSKEERHNTCTPIARYLSDGKFCLEIILRNNVTSETFPDGVFHAHPEYHNIKKEGIGLIEAMGLYILPGRLKKQIEEIASIICKEQPYDGAKIKEDNPLYVHVPMIEKLIKNNPDITDLTKAREVVKDYVNKTCVSILENTAVFKKDEMGTLAFKRFLNTLEIR